MVLKKDDKAAKKPKAKVWVKPKPAPAATPVLFLESKAKDEMETNKKLADHEEEGSDKASEESFLLKLTTAEVCFSFQLLQYLFLNFRVQMKKTRMAADLPQEDDLAAGRGRRT